MRLQAVRGDGFDEVGQVLQLGAHQSQHYSVWLMNGWNHQLVWVSHGRLAHLMPVQCRLVDLLHRAWLQFVDEPGEKQNKTDDDEEEEQQEGGGAYVVQQDNPRFWTHGPMTLTQPWTHSHRMTPLFRPFWKSGPIGEPVMSSIQILSSSSFWGSYFWAICSDREVRGHISGLYSLPAF